MRVCLQCHEITDGGHRCDACGADLTLESNALDVPRLDDGYILDEGPPLGKGSFAEVHAATSRVDGTRWAIKRVDLRKAATSARVRKQLRASFLREASALTVLRHPHIVTVSAFGAQDADTLFMAMELLPGGQTLQGVLVKAVKRGKKPGLNTLLRVFEEVGAALAYIHERQLIHRDLKPANIGIDANRRFKLLDFGLVKVVGEGFGATPDAVSVAGWGSYNYGAPEQFFNGVIGPWTDIYALGAILYEMIAGRPPVTDGTLERILESMNRPADPLPPDRDRPLPLTDLIMDMLQKCPADRPQTVAEVLTRVRAIRRDAQAALEDPGASVSLDPAPTPSTGVRVIRTRHGETPPRLPPSVRVVRTVAGAETRPADARAVELIQATKPHPGRDLPPLDLSFDATVARAPGARPPLPVVVPPRPFAIAAAGLGALLIGVAGLWWSIGR